MPTVSELQAQIEALKEQERQLDRESRARQSTAWDLLIQNPKFWEWRATPATREDWYTKEKLSGVHVSRRANPEMLAEWQKGGFSTFSSEWQDGSWRGMFYYRTCENILYHEGGGHCVLRDVIICPDSEWEELLAGKIPERLKR